MAKDWVGDNKSVFTALVTTNVKAYTGFEP